MEMLSFCKRGPGADGSASAPRRRLESPVERLPESPFGQPPALPWSVQASLPGWEDEAPGWRPEEDLMHLHEPVLVASLWQRLLAVLREPAVVATSGRRCAVQVLGCARFERGSDGRWQVWLWRAADRDQPEQLAWDICPADEVVLHPIPAGWTWLGLIRRAAVAEIVRHGRSAHLDVSLEEVERYAQALFGHFQRRLARQCDLRTMRRRVAVAMRLNPEALAIARRFVRASEYPQARLADYNLVMARRDEFRTLQREAPSVIPLYAAVCTHPDFPPIDEPVGALSHFLHQRGLAPRTWRLVAKASGRLLLPVRSFYRGNAGEAMLDYLRVLEDLDLHAEPPVWFTWCVLSRVANPGYRFESHHADLERHLGRFAVAARHLMRLEVMPADRDEVPAVLEWLASASPQMDERQRHAGWAWMVRQARDWQERERRAAEARKNPWAVPVEVFEHDGLMCKVLGDSFALWEEGQAMRHCIVDFGPKCSEGEALAVSIREAAGPGRRVATALLKRVSGRWEVKGVRGFANAEPTARARQAAGALVLHLRAVQQRRAVS